MKTIILALVLVAPLYVTGQSITEWTIKTDSLIQTLPSGSNQLRFNEIVDNRNSYRVKSIFDTTFQVVRIQEMFDVNASKFDQNIEYINNINADELVGEWNYESIDSIKPRNYVMYLGCLIKKRTPQRVKRWERKINKMDPAMETYFIVDTILDKRTGTMRISLRIPVSAKRKLEAFYGPFGKSRRPYLERWYY